MPQELYSATIAGNLDGTERLWLGDDTLPYYLTLNRLVYKNTSNRYFLTGPLHIDSGAGGVIYLGDIAAPFSITFDDAGGEVLFKSPSSFILQADSGSMLSSNGVTEYVGWDSSGIRVRGLKIADTNFSHYLTVAVGSNLTANRTFTLTTGNADRTLDMSIGSITFSIDGTLAGNSDAIVPTQKAVKTYVDAAVTGLMDFKGSTDCSGNPNYPAASKGDAYVVSVAGKIGGASGTSVDVGDVYVASADNAGGTQASVGTSWFVLEHNLAGVLLASGLGSVTQAWDADLDAAAASGLAAAWSATTPTPTAFSGTFTTVSANVHAVKIGKIVHFNATVTITTNGTAAGFIDVALPYASANTTFPHAFGGKEVGVTGTMISGAILNNSTTLRISKYDGTYPGATGHILVISGTYEAA